jgi:hypothetical protein
VPPVWPHSLKIIVGADTMKHASPASFDETVSSTVDTAKETGLVPIAPDDGEKPLLTTTKLVCRESPFYKDLHF